MTLEEVIARWLRTILSQDRPDRRPLETRIREGAAELAQAIRAAFRLQRRDDGR